MSKQKISICAPMYNESLVVGKFFEKINETIADLEAKNPDLEFEIVVTNDGSRDDTLEQLKAQTARQKNLRVVNLSRNFGHDPAIFACVEHATGDAIIVMDADLQDPPELIGPMCEKFLEGYDVVNAKRTNRKVDRAFQRHTASLYYKLLNKLSYKVKYPENVNSFRLISRRVAKTIKTFPSNEKIFRNSVAQAGFKTCEIEFVRQARVGGKTKYNKKAMMRLALSGIADSGVKPLSFGFYISIWFGIIGGFLTLLALSFGIASAVTPYESAPWLLEFCASPLFIIGSVFSFFILFTGIGLSIHSISAFYLGKAYTEIKARPIYSVENVYEGGKADGAASGKEAGVSVGYAKGGLK